MADEYYEEEEEYEEYEEQTILEEVVDDTPAMPPAPPAGRPVHPLFGGGGAKNELAMAAARMNQDRPAEEPSSSSKLVPAAAPPQSSAAPPANRPPHPLFGGGGGGDTGKNALNAAILAKAAQRNGGGTAAAPQRKAPDAVAQPRPKPPPNQPLSMADQAVLMAQRRQQRVAAQGDENVAPPAPSSQAVPESKPPVFAHAKLRSTPAAAPAASQAPEEPKVIPAMSQSRLRGTEGGIDTRAAPQQASYQPESSSVPPPPPQQQDPEADVEQPLVHYTTEEKPVQYERVLVSKQEPHMVTQHRVISNDPEYGTFLWWLLRFENVVHVCVLFVLVARCLS